MNDTNTNTNTNAFDLAWGGARPKQEVAGKTIREKAKQIADTEQQLLRETMNMDIAEQDQWYQNGTKMLDCGEEIARELRKEFEAMPLAEEAFDATVAMIEAEQRVDHLVPLKDVRLDRDGLMQGVNGGLHVSGQAMRSMVYFAPKDMDSGVKYNLNRWLGGTDRKAMFRTRSPQPDGTAHLYAVASEKYSRFDLDQVCESLREHMPEGSRAAIDYDGSRWSINVDLAPTWESDSSDIAVGRVFRIRFKATGGDDKSRGLKGMFQANRIQCINCTTMTDSKLVLKRRHVGEIVELFDEAASMVGTAMDAFRQYWAPLSREVFRDASSGAPLDAKQTFQRLIAHGYIKIPGKAYDNVDRFLCAFDEEPGETAMHINNALTRAAHTYVGDWRTPWVVEDLEQQAGALVFEQVFTLPQMTSRQEAVFEG